MSTLFNKTAFYPTLLYNILLNKLTSRNWYDRIDETVVLGALPFKSMTQELIDKENIRCVVSLTEDYETKQFVNSKEDWQKYGVELLSLQTVDYVGTPSQENIDRAVQFIMRYRQKKSSVYVHCKAGRTRSATVVACYLVKLHGWAPDVAVDLIQSKRPHIWLRDKQWETIKMFYNTCQKSRNLGGG